MPGETHDHGADVIPGEPDPEVVNKIYDGWDEDRKKKLAEESGEAEDAEEAATTGEILAGAAAGTLVGAGVGYGVEKGMEAAGFSKPVAEGTGAGAAVLTGAAVGFWIGGPAGAVLGGLGAGLLYWATQ